MSQTFDENLVGEFIAESREHLDAIEPDLLILERGGDSLPAETINRIFRAIHSVKGGAGFLAFEGLKRLSHSMEGVLMLARDGKLTLVPEITDILLRGVDKLRTMLDDIQISDQIPCGEELQALGAILEGEIAPPKAVAAAPKAGPLSVNDALSGMGITVAELLALHPPSRYLYRVGVDVARDLIGLQLTPKLFFKNLDSVGSVLACTTNLEALHASEEAAAFAPGFALLFSSVLEPDLITSAVDMPAEAIVHIPVQEPSPEKPAEERQAGAAVVSGANDLVGQILIQQFHVDPHHIERSMEIQKNGDKRPLCAILMSIGAVSGKTVTDALEFQRALREQEQQKKAEVQRQAVQSAPETLRVRVELLTRLMNSASELVLARNRLLRAFEPHADRLPGVQEILQNVDFVTTELQEGIMQTRLQPLGSVFGKFTRIVRDIARQLGKRIELKVQGAEVELDKSIIEALSDPLTHLVRNSADHGIEPPDERERAGKPVQGTILMRAFHEGGQVRITLTDDGRGIDARKVAKKAIEKGILRQEEAETSSERDLLGLIFAPGFSTAEKISDVSGRGVGMDVVRTNIEKLGGTVQVESTVGEGTTIVLQLPLTLSIIPSIIIGVDHHRFAIPQVNVEEFVWVRAAEVKEMIERFHGRDVLRLRGSLLPLIRLTSVLGISKSRDVEGQWSEKRSRIADRRSPDDEHGELAAAAEAARQRGPDRRRNWRDDYNVVVIKQGVNRFGLIVDSLFDTEEIVVKPLSHFLKRCRCYSGATILGDGRVIMILDVFGVSSMAKLHFADLAAEEERRRREQLQREAEAAKSRRSVILFTAGEGDYFAVPQEAILRLERLAPDAIQTAGGREYIEYRGKGLPLVRLDSVLPVRPLPHDAPEVYLLIPKGQPGEPVAAGILVSRVLDALDVEVELEAVSASGPGLDGAAIVDNRMTLFLNPQPLLQAVGLGGRGNN